MATVPTITSVSSSTDSQTLFTANADRNNLIITNASTAILYVRLTPPGVTTAATSTTGHSFQMATLTTMVLGPYRGAATGIWASANGQANITSIE